MAADLAHFHKIWGFSIKMSKWNDFLEGHWFNTMNCDGTFEVDQQKVDLSASIKGESPKNREKVYFIRIGILNSSSPRKVEMQKNPLRGLQSQQSTFQSLIEPILWNYILDNDDLEEGNEVDELSSDDEDDSAVMSPPLSMPPSSIATSITPVKSSNTVDDNIS